MEFKKAGAPLRNTRKHWAFFWVCLAVVIGFVVAMLYMNHNVQATVTPNAVDKVMLQNGDVFKQELIHQGGELRELHLIFTKETARPEGDLKVSLYAGDTLLQEWTRPAKAIDNTEIFEVGEKIELTDGVAYYAVIKAELKNENSVGLKVTSDDGFGTGTYKEVALQGQSAVYALVYADHNAKLIDLFHIGMYVLFGVLLVATAYVLLYTKIKKEVLFTALILVLGLSFMVCITPTSPPDEPHHYHSAYQLSNYLLFQGDTAEYGKAADFDYHDFKGHNNIPDAYLRVLSEFGEAATDGGDQIVIPAPRKLTYFVQYLPQAIGIAAMRLLGRNMVTIFMVGRLCNLLFYTVCAYFAVKRLSKFKVPMGLVAMLPMALHQAASYSYDGFVNGMALLLVSAIIDLLLTDKTVTIKDLLFIGIVAALLAPAKVIYCPLLLLLFLVKKERFGSMKRKLLSIGCILLVCAVMIMLIQLPTMMEMTSRGETKLNHEGEYNYTPAFILQDPLEAIGIFVKTFYRSFYSWSQQAIGSVFSGLNLAIPAWIPTAYMFILMLVVLNKPKLSVALKVRDRFWILLTILMIVALVMASMFVGWTSNDSEFIQGVQGRYFIPLLPLIVLMVANENLSLKKNIDRELIFASTVLCVTSLASVLEYTVAR